MAVPSKIPGRVLRRVRHLAVLVGWIRRTWQDTGSSAAWQAQDAQAWLDQAHGQGATPRGNARTRDKAARKLLVSLTQLPGARQGTGCNGGRACRDAPARDHQAHNITLFRFIITFVFVFVQRNETE